jgi:hypothetical protein
MHFSNRAAVATLFYLTGKSLGRPFEHGTDLPLATNQRPALVRFDPDEAAFPAGL